MYLFDQTGRQYMDLESGVWCTALGHNDKRVNAAIKNQIDSIMHAGFCYSSNILDEAADAVLSITSLENGKCVFLCSGSEAIELLRQITKTITGTQKTLTLHDAYLGSYSSVINRDENWHSFNWEQCRTCPEADNCDPDCKALADIPCDISEFVFEPGSAAGFVRFPPPALIQNIVAIVRSRNGKIIVNDVTTGVGRTGKWFGFQHYPIQPDMVAIGKGIGNGYPVSVAVLSRGIVDELGDNTFTYSQSHQNDPLGAAVANEVIQVIEDGGLIKQTERKGKQFLGRLNTLMSNEIVLDVRGRGLMFAVDFVNERVGDAVYNDLVEKGYIVCNRRGSLRIDPPLIITEDEFSRFFAAFAAIIESVNLTV